MSKARDLASGQNGVRPYAMAAGSGTYTHAATVTFPASRFSVAPIVNVTLNGNVSTLYNIIVGQVNATTSGFTFIGVNTSNTGITVNAAWTAIQMTSSAAAG